MTSYADVPKLMALHAEQQRIIDAIQMIDTGGSLVSFIVKPPPMKAGDTPGLTGVSITTSESPPSSDFIAHARAWLEQRQDEINNAFAVLGITDGPVSAKAKTLANK